MPKLFGWKLDGEAGHPSASGLIAKLLKRRYARWRRIGRTTTVAALAAERLADQIETGVRGSAQRLSSLAQQIPEQVRRVRSGRE